MPRDTDDGTNGEDEDDSPQSYREHQLAKRGERAKNPDDAGPRDPAAEMCEEAGIGSGFEALEADGDVEKSAQETLEDALDDWDPTGSVPVEKDDGDRVNLSLTKRDIKEAQQSPQEREEALLRAIRGELHQLNRTAEFGGSVSTEDVAKALGKDTVAGRRWVALMDVEDADPVDLLEGIEDELERQEGTEDAAKTAVEAYVEDGGSFRDDLAGFATFLRSNLAEPDGDDEQQARRRIRSRLDQMLAAEDGQTPA